MMKGVRVVLCLGVLVCCTNSAHGSLFGKLIADMQKCLLDLQIPPVDHSNQIAKVILGTIQDKSSFTRVMNCVEYIYNNTVSPEYDRLTPEHKFLVRMFSARAGSGEFAEQMYKQGMATAWNCIPTSLDYCFSKCELSIMMVDFTQCLAIRHNDSCSSTLHRGDCSTSVVSTIEMLIDMMFAKCNLLSSSPTPSTTRMMYYTAVVTQSGPIPDYFHIFQQCGEGLYSALNLTYLFPPSEINKVYFQYTYNTNFQTHLNEFCSKIEPYSLCVTQRLINDRRVGLFINARNFTKAFKKYCDNKDLIVAQSQCTLNSLSQNTCHGGMLDLLRESFNKLRIPSPFGYECGDLLEKLKCRVEKQLRPCNSQYADVMNDVVTSLISADCQKNGYVIEQNNQTDIMPCFYNYSIEAQKLVIETSNNDNPITSVISQMNLVCKHMDGIYTCMEEKWSTSTKHVDIWAKKNFPVAKSRKISKHLCSLMPVISENLYCLLTKISQMTTNNDSCLITITTTIANEMGGLFQNTNPDLDVMKGVITGILKQYSACLKPTIASCNAKLGDEMELLVENLSGTLTDPNYEVKERLEGGENSMATLIPTLTTVFGALVASMYF